MLSNSKGRRPSINSRKGVVAKNSVSVNKVVKESNVQPNEEELIEVEEPVLQENLVEEVVEEKESKEVVKEEPKQQNNGKPVFGGKKPISIKKKSESVGNIFPRKLFVERLKSRMDEKWDGLTKADVEFIFGLVEEEFLKAAQEATFRFAGGVAKVRESKPRVTAPPALEEKVLMMDRKQVVYTADLDEPEKFRGDFKDETRKVFIVTSQYNYETKEWEPVEGEVEL